MNEPFETKQYYKNVDYALWDDIFLVCKEKLESGSEEIKKQWSLELYSKYLQILEVLCINILVVGFGNIENLFISNKDLREDILKFTKDNQIKNQFVNQVIFHIKDKNKIKNFEKRKALYLRILNEALKDYLKDYDFLNAYKHGFRVETKGESRIWINEFPLGEYNTTLTYFSKEKHKETKEEIIFKNSRCFNWERILYKSLFILDILKKLKISSSMTTGEEVTLNLLYIIDEENFNKSYGTFRSKEAFLHQNHPR